MNDRFVFSMWTYNDLEEFTPDELDKWVECGMTIPMLPKTFISKHDPKLLIPWLDRAEKLGVKVIVNYWDMCYKDYIRLGEEEYTRLIAPLYDAIGSHPAVYGFYVGDEPLGGEQIEAAFNCVRINKKLAPHLTPFLNYRGGTVSFSKEDLGGRTLGEWMKHVRDETGTTDICYDVYSQMINDGGGKDGFFKILGRMCDAGKEAEDSEVWACLLSSGHHVYAAPNETDIRWQINMSAALGMRGVMWFRFYDRVGANELFGSPIDEYGNKTEAYYAMMRCQRRFTDNYGEIFMKLKHKKTFAARSERGIFPEFTEGCHELIRSIKPNDEAIVSFFEDDKGVEYLCIVHGVTKYYGVVNIVHDADKCTLTEVRLNGKQCGKVGDDENGEFVFIPAGLKLLRIDRK